jgi:hypothetical protein
MPPGEFIMGLITCTLDDTSDLADGDYTPGNLTLREAAVWPLPTPTPTSSSSLPALPAKRSC